ncbi:MAG: M20/M25/M40 family metallo-hydrolase [Bacteroidota bacterium]
MMKILLVFIFLFSITIGNSQKGDSIFIEKIYHEALVEGHSYENLRSLCKDVGNRLSGTAGAQMAVEWAKSTLEKYNFDTVYLQKIMVPHWDRGTTERAWIQIGDKKTALSILALGGSIGTEGLMKGEVIEFNSLEALKKASKSAVQGKIVFINQRMNDNEINTFRAYGSCSSMRVDGAVEAAKLGAKAVVIRSLGLAIDDHPHTGVMKYDSAIKKIPAAAISTQDSDLLSDFLRSNKVNILFELNCRTLPDEPSFNVIAEMKGTKNPNQIITFGGHLDSWDTGEGAHDDGAGVVHCMEALRILKKLNYTPDKTLRVVLFMNEENGNRGGKGYADWVVSRGEKHIAALESDRGGFAPRGFSCDGTAEQVKFLKTLEPLLKKYELHVFEKGYGGVDIGPLKSKYTSIPLFGFVPDSQRYFDFHHTPNDIFENVNKRELELGAAAVCSFIYLLDLNL